MKLAKREIYALSIGACAIVIFFLLQFLIFPFFENRERLRRGIKVKGEGLREMAMLRAEYNTLQKSTKGIRNMLAKRKRGFTLFSFLDSAAGEAKVKDHITYMKPSISKGSAQYKESMVEMKLEALTLGQLVGYLHRIETVQDLIIVKRISIKGNKKKSGYLDAVLQVLTFQ